MSDRTLYVVAYFPVYIGTHGVLDQKNFDERVEKSGLFSRGHIE